MRRLSTILFTVMTLAAAAACSSSPTAPVNSTFTLAPGQSQVVGSITVKFVGVTEDTRCPINAMCIQVGDAYVALEVSAPGTRRELELQLLNPTKRAAHNMSNSRRPRCPHRVRANLVNQLLLRRAF